MAIDIEIEYDKIHRYCCFHVKDPYLAEDLTQETFLRLLARQPDLSGGNRTAYLYTIARNLCIDAWRRLKTEELTEDTSVIHPFDHIEEQMDLKAAVLLLPAILQELLLLRYSEELTVGETAKILEMSRFAVYRREKEALRQLQENLKGGTHFEEN